MASAQRCLCLLSLKKALEEVNFPGDSNLLSQEFEHANMCMAANNELAYGFQIQTTLVHIRSGKLQQLFEAMPKENILEVLKLPRDVLFDEIPCYKKVDEEDKKKEQGFALLNILRSEELNDVPNTGIACGKCRSKDIIYGMGQTRSADEGTTVWATCQSCSKRWKI